MLAFLFWVSVIFVAYTYLGYPLLIALAARFIRKHTPTLVSDPSVTLLITAYNEENVIGKKIENSLSLDYPADKLQIIVAADGSTDQTPEIVINH